MEFTFPGYCLPTFPSQPRFWPRTHPKLTSPCISMGHGGWSLLPLPHLDPNNPFSEVAKMTSKHNLDLLKMYLPRPPWTLALSPTLHLTQVALSPGWVVISQHIASSLAPAHDGTFPYSSRILFLLVFMGKFFSLGH